jgi:hypothetical protein
MLAHQSQRMTTLITAAALLAIMGCNSRKAVQAICEIKGTVAWENGAGGPDPSVVNDAVTITALTMGSSSLIPLPGAHVAWGSPSTAGPRVTVSYTVSKLPLNTAIRLVVKPNHVQGQFIRDGNPQDALCTFAQPSVSQFDFRFLPAP